MVAQGRIDNQSPAGELVLPPQDLFIFFVVFIIQKKVADIKNKKSRPAGVAFLLHKHERD